MNWALIVADGGGKAPGDISKKHSESRKGSDMFFPRMMTILTVAGLAATCAYAQGGADNAQTEIHRETLWEIGRVDRDTSEFALGPDGYREFKHDAFYVVGESTPKADWPYVQPGPVDGWGGSRPHTFTIMFGLQEPLLAGPCRLVIDLVDTHHGMTPRLELECNGTLVNRHVLPPGASDKSIGGAPGEGRPHQFVVEFNAELLNQGANEVAIRTTAGSWILYDAIRFEAPSTAQLATVPQMCNIRSVSPQICLVEREGQLWQPVALDIVYAGAAESIDCLLNGVVHQAVELQPGRQTITVHAPAVDSEAALAIELQAAGQTLASAEMTLEPVRRWIVHLLHFTHLDIGYTHIQERVEQRQMEFLDQAQKLIRETDDYPPEARFKWLPEGLWAVESYLKQADDATRKTFIDNVNAGRIELCGLYGNALTGLYTEEELFALVDYATQLRAQYGVTIDTAMLTDVPGCTWGMVPVLAHAGIRHFSLSPNPAHRIGWTRLWDDRPFYWVSPCGQHKVLCWMAPGYGWFRSGLGDKPVQRLLDGPLLGHLAALEKQNYPYDIVQLRYDIGADNGPPDPTLPDGVRAWNETYAYPKLVISTPRELFEELEQRYGDCLPVVRGDFTPYWEDGAASTAGDTTTNRRAVETLLQAQALWTLLDAGGYPAECVYASWRNAVLYDEHTWGAWNSISEPDSEFARHQAERKHRFALDANALAQQVFDEALATRRCENQQVRAIEVFNTESWDRSDLVVLPADMDLVGDIVRTADGTAVPSQRLSTGELAFLAKNVPAMGSVRFTIHAGRPADSGDAVANRTFLTNGRLRVTLDAQSGSIVALEATGIPGNLVGGDSDAGLNDYIYVAGRDPKQQKRVDPRSVTFDILDHGPLVATVRVTSSAPGARGLARTIRLVDGLDRVEITNVIDKLPIREKEGVHFAFPLNVPDGEVHMDMPWAVVRPEKDQIEGACRNFFAVQRWVDVSNRDQGVTWATIDAPLVQLGAIRTDIVSAVAADGAAWLRHIESSQTLYSYVMNNYWETNYKADQAGPTTFRYALRPHTGLYDQTAANRFGIECNRPLVAVSARVDGPPALAPPFHLDARGVIVTALKPSRDGRARIIRLYAASGKPENVHLVWPGTPPAIYLSDPNETRGERVSGPIRLSAYGFATLRVEP